MESRNRIRISQIKLQAGCVDCGWNDHPAALQFDHVAGVKVGNVSEMMKRSWATIAAEIDKCQIVCANHHAIRTWERVTA